MNRCEECGGRFDRPGLFGCDEDRHPKPDYAQAIILAIEDDIRDRRGLGNEFDAIDDDTLDEIRDEWADIIRSRINPA